MFEKICLHFEVPFECHSLDLTSILFNSYVQAPHKSTMLDGIKNSRLWEKLVGLHWGREGNKICVLVNLEIRHLRDAIIFCVLIVVPLS